MTWLLLLSASEVLLVKDDVGGKIDANGTKDGRGGDVHGDGLCELDDHAHEEGREDLREKEGAVQNGKIQSHPTFPKILWLQTKGGTVLM